MRAFRKAFTLIELLVVIAIIALLVSILLPSLNRAKELAKKTVCLSQMKGLGLTALMYADTYNDCLPMVNIHDAAAYPVTKYVLWYHLLAPFAGEATGDSYTSSAGAGGQWDFAEIFKACPVPMLRPDLAPGPWNSGYGMVTAIHYLDGKAPVDEWSDYENRINVTSGNLWGVPQAGENGHMVTHRAFKRNEFSDTSRRGWITDSNAFHAGGGPNERDEPGNDFYPTWSLSRANGGYGLGNDPERHAGSSNIWFIDGHAKDYKYDVGGNAFYDLAKLPQ